MDKGKAVLFFDEKNTSAFFWINSGTTGEDLVYIYTYHLPHLSQNMENSWEMMGFCDTIYILFGKLLIIPGKRDDYAENDGDYR